MAYGPKIQNEGCHRHGPDCSCTCNSRVKFTEINNFSISGINIINSFLCHL